MRAHGHSDMWTRVAGAALGPVLYLQGRWIRRTLPALPEPDGAPTGRHAVSGSGNTIRLLVVGDSAAAGVGAPTQAEGLLGQLVRALAADGSVVWRLIARRGATAAGTRRHLLSLPAEPFDAAVTSLGLNDLLLGRRPADVLADVVDVVSILRSRFGVRRVLVSGMPPVGRFPALPQPLRWYMGRRARALDTGVGAWAATAEGVEFLPLAVEGQLAPLMARDGFHPGPKLYATWGRAAAARIAAAGRSAPRE